jgi:hypothetical protein
VAEITSELVYEILRQIQASQVETNRKIGVLAESMVHQTKRIDHLSGRIDHLEVSINTMRADIRMIAIAVDEHTERLAALDGRPPILP